MDDPETLAQKLQEALAALFASENALQTSENARMAAEGARRAAEDDRRAAEAALEAGGQLKTKQQLLQSSLPPANPCKKPGKEHLEGHTPAFRMKLQGVGVWERSPDGSCTLEEAIKQHVDAADNTQRIYNAFPTYVLAVDGPERDVQDRLASFPLDRLSSFAGNTASWERELSLQKVTSLFTCFSPGALAAGSEQQQGQQEEQLHGSGPKSEGGSVPSVGHAPPAAAPSCSSWSAPTRPYQAGSSTRSSRKTVPDFALMRAASQQQQQQQQQQDWRQAIKQFIAVSEAKRVTKCCQNGEPVDLVRLHGQESSEASDVALRQSVRRMLRQLFTYMVVTGVQFGWLSCWRATWLAWRRLDDPHRLMLSRAFKDTDGGGRGGGNTALAALSWLQDLAIAAQDKRHGIDLSIIRGKGEPDSDDDEEEEAGSDGGPLDDGSIVDKNDGDYVPNQAKRRKASTGPPSGSAPARGQRVSIPLLPAEAVAVLGDVLGEGSSCVVVRAQCQGREAALKLLTCDKPLEAARNEASIYQVLVDLQGKQVPFLLGVGRLALGPVFIGTSLVRGVPLSQLPSLSREVRAAAMHSVGNIHRHKVVHGDLQLDNLLLVEQLPTGAEPMDPAVINSGSSGSGSQASPSPPQVQAVINSSSNSGGSEASPPPPPASPGPPQVMIIDFGRAYAQACPEALEYEEQRVKRLLGIRGP